VVSLATDARDQDRVYVAAGTYTNDWDPSNGAILRSRPRGAQLTRQRAAVQASPAADVGAPGDRSEPQ